MAALGGAAGVPTPVISGLVAIASALTKCDFVAEGRTLERSGSPDAASSKSWRASGDSI